MTAHALAITRLQQIPRTDRRAALESLVSAEFKRALLMSAEDDLPVDANCFDLGLTSLRATEVKQRLEAELGCELDISLLFGSPTVHQVVEHIAGVALPHIFTGPTAKLDLPSVPAQRSLVATLISDLLDTPPWRLAGPSAMQGRDGE
jgi:acyl carrier protein